MKPMYMQPNKGQYNWNDADTMVNFCLDNDIKIVGHTFVWHQQSPGWMTTSGDVEQNMKNHIEKVMNRYKGKIWAWDVVNEAFRDSVYDYEASQGWENCLRTDSGWYTALGADYIYKAFKYAKATNSGAELIYNDFNLDYTGKSKAVAQMVAELNARYKQETGTDDNLIDVVGMQSHYDLNVSVDKVEAAIKRFRDAGVKVHITELDVGTVDPVSSLSAADEQLQAKKYAELFKIYKKYSDVIERVTFWGYEDSSSWRANRFPCLFNADFTPKAAFNAVMNPENY